MASESAVTISELPEARRAEAAAFVAASGQPRAGAVAWMEEAPTPDALLRREERVALAGDAIIGLAAAWEQCLCLCRCELFVADGNSEVADALLESLLAEISGWPDRPEIRVHARAASDDAAELALLARHGFAEVHRMARLQLDVASADDNALDAAIEKMAALCVRLTTMAAERAAGRDPMPELWRTKNGALPFWADYYGGAWLPEPLTYERFLNEEHWRDGDEAIFLAAHGDNYVGYTTLWDDATATDLKGTGETAVRPEWQGLGVASALKASAIRRARADGARMIWTTTASAAMRAVNEKFGFRETTAEVRLLRRLTSGAKEG